VDRLVDRSLHSPRLVVVLLLVATAAFAAVATSIVCQTLLQGTVDGHMRGRVMSLYGMIMRAGPAVGALALGVLSERYGLQPTVLASSVGCALAWLWAETQRRRWAPTLEGHDADGPS